MKRQILQLCVVCDYIALALICPVIVQKIRPTLSTNQMQNESRSRLNKLGFPAFRVIYLF